MSLAERLQRAALGALPPLAAAAAWQYAASVPGTLVPAPAEVARIALSPLTRPENLDAPSLGFSAAASLLRVGLGYAAAAALALPLGLAMGRSRLAHALAAPLTTMLRVVCPLAWLPLAILTLGTSSFAEHAYGLREAWRHDLLNEIQPAMVLIIAWGAFFPILLATAAAARSTRTALLESAALLGAGRWARLRHVVLPSALPGAVNGMRIGLGIAWMVIVAAELYPGTRSGLGYTIWVSHNTVQYEYTFAAMLYIMILGLLLNGALLALERRVGRWQAAQR